MKIVDDILIPVSVSSLNDATVTPRHVSSDKVSWAVLGDLGPSWSCLGTVLRRLGPIFGRSYGVLGRSKAVLEQSWTVLGPSWSILRRLRDDLGTSWAFLGL